MPATFGPIADAPIAAIELPPIPTPAPPWDGVVRIGGCCCPGNSGLCANPCCPATNIPCDICVQIVSMTLVSENPDCGTIDYSSPPPWIVNVGETTGFDDAFVGTVINTAILDIASGYFRTRLVCGVDDTATWFLGLGLFPGGDCTSLEAAFDDIVADEIEVSCDLSELFGTHTVELSGVDDDLFPYTLTLAYSVTGGNGCGIHTECCDKRVSRILGIVFTFGISTASATIQWNGSAWAVVESSNSMTGHTGALVGSLSCIDGTWHVIMADDGGVFYDDDLAVGSCQPVSLSGDNGVMTCAVSQNG